MARYEIPTFKAERDDGVAGMVRANASVAYLAPLEPAAEGDPGAVGAIVADLRRAVAARDDGRDFDLYHLKDILVTAGVVNRNRDAFDRAEVWGARHTPEDKPFNFEHEPLDIIGHITASRAVRPDMTEIPDDTPVEDLPSKYHLVNGSVLYMGVGDDDRRKLMQRTVAEIERGEWFVSMECFFHGFDYGVTCPDGSQRVIARGADTAWLTKHLVQYGGTGAYVDEETGAEYQLSRLLRNITFSGKGLVRKPANDESVILGALAAFDPTPADSGYLTAGHHATSSDTQEPISMAESNATEQPLRDENARLTQRVSELLAEVAGLKSRDTEAAIAGLRTQVDDLRRQVTDRDATIAGLNTQVAAITEASRAVERRATDAEAALASCRDDLAAVEASETRRVRVAAMKERNADDAVAETLAETWSHLSDEQFAATLDRVSASWKRAETPPAKPKVDPVVRAIDGARAETEPSLATANEGSAEEREQSFAKITDFMSKSLKSARSGRPSIYAGSNTTDAE